MTDWKPCRHCDHLGVQHATDGPCAVVSFWAGLPDLENTTRCACPHFEEVGDD